jgi:glycerophosphoryl diester phosphodiesterase
MVTVPRPTLIAHRGDPSRGPENTVASIRLALEARPDLVEVDVHLSADGHPVVIHDATLERTTSGTGKVGSLSLEELRRFDAGRWYGQAFAGEHMPTLEEAWRAVTGESRLLVELKGAGTGTVVGRWARRLTERVPTFISFRVQELGQLREELPTAELWLLGAQAMFAGDLLASLLSSAQESGCSGLVVSGKECPPGALLQVHGRGLGLWIGSVNEPGKWEELIGLGADGLITDRPLELRRFLESTGQRSAAS